MKNSNQFQKTTAIALSLFVVLSQTPVFALNSPTDPNAGLQGSGPVVSLSHTTDGGSPAPANIPTDPSASGPISARTETPDAPQTAPKGIEAVPDLEQGIITSIFGADVKFQVVKPRVCASGDYVCLPGSVTTYYDSKFNAVGEKSILGTNAQFKTADGTVYSFKKVDASDPTVVTGIFGADVKYQVMVPRACNPGDYVCLPGSVTAYYDSQFNVVGEKDILGAKTQFKTADGSKVYDFGKLTGMEGQGITGVTYNLPGHDPIHIDFDYTGNTSGIQVDLKALDTAVSDLVKKGLAQPQFTLKNYSLAVVACIVAPCSGEGSETTFDLNSPLSILKYDLHKSFDPRSSYEIKSVTVQNGPVQTFINTLRDLFRKMGFDVSLGLQRGGFYQIIITDLKDSIAAQTSGLQSMTLWVDKNGNLDSSKPIVANYYGPKGRTISVNGNLLFQAMSACPSGDRCTTNANVRAETSAELLAKMAAVIVDHVDAKGVIYYSLNNEKFKAYRDANGQVVVKRDDPIHNFLDALQASLGKGFNVSLALQKDGSYQITIGSYAPTNTGFRSMTFSVDKNGNVDSSKPIAVNYVQNASRIAVDGNLLFQGMKACLQGQACMAAVNDVDALKSMASITVTDVDRSGAIHFDDKNGNHFKVFRDQTTGKVVREQEYVVISN